MKDINNLVKLFERCAHRQNYSAAFGDLLDFILIPLKMHDTAEGQQQALATLTEHPKRQQLVPLMTEVGELAEGFCDPLGALYEQLISKGHNGQFFTPDPVAELLAKLTAAGEAQTGERVLDPACGSGRMLLAAAKVNRHRRFYGADIDPLCCKMALVNMLLNSLTGEIAHMDSLSNNFYTGYKAETVLRDGYHYPYYQEFTDPEESYIWLRPRPQTSPQGFSKPFDPSSSPIVSGVQGTLF
jgi:type I restriction enzyme M protein